MFHGPIVMDQSSVRSVCIFLYILAIAGQTSGPNWLKCFEETHGHSGGNIG